MMPLIRQLTTFLAIASLAVAVPRQAGKSLLQKRETLPEYALTYAPLSYLYSGEKWWPSDITTHLANVEPEVNYTAIGTNGSVTVDTLDSYASDVYLTASDGPILNPLESTPAWLASDYGIPDSDGLSAAPGLIIAVEKNSTTTDVFYFYFYSYNYGGTVLDINFDDHVGDWEHVMIRFINEQPYAIYCSQHSAGSAYYWDVVDFSGDRPLTYIAYGGHANYVTAGTQDYTIALGIVSDTTDAGYLWDMTLNYRGYWYDGDTGAFTVAGGAGTGATEEAAEQADWLNWLGAWGDEQYPDDLLDDLETGQYCIVDECRYTSGPTGPVDKNLARTTMCEDDDDCTIFDNIDDLTHQS
ncbi:uncharacterized protein BP01DRAFT_203576 [Aspergillus saccharolyticus JOP 1030-1]|uniref:Vacuolar protein sorting-associated protein 62 n=1 Tax=Aspergillus saccharolyticus JOP 1030-1 TaxID=1450539 RepID=A0A318ZZE1_9EURO|nr:hypothetical protein BP01DRAFT_203576 [Aspergillus saccharolyticus JOP 1030-1]PYH40722.1 hypothetical protein BP01DRAFT_203576 [Aspergillus saccharolyticus JOP 1030-1]